MKNLQQLQGVWIVYDGGCPICSYAAQAIHIKQRFGSISLLNKRETDDHPLIEEITKRGFDLDQGMVIYAEQQFYFGKDALQFIAKYGQGTNGFMLFAKGLFWSDRLSRLIYPWMRAARNWLIRRNKVGHIDNLNHHQTPIFKTVFGKDWEALPPVMKKHYGNRPYCTDQTELEGELDVYCKPPLAWLSWLMRLLGQIPAYNEKQVAIKVSFDSDIHSKAFHFNRRFYFSGKRPYVFRSHMLPIKDNEVIEIMRFGLAWKSRFFWDGEKVIIQHNGYALQAFGHLVPLPLTILLGAGNAVEYPVDDDSFTMQVTITHPCWGDIYGYGGRFKVLK